MRCEKTDLLAEECAHCRGVDSPTVPPNWTLPEPPPVRKGQPLLCEAEESDSLGWYETPLLREVADLYVRLTERLPAESAGRSTDNAATYAPSADPRRAPVRIEVLDLLHRIEQEVPDLARSVCDAMGLMQCLVFPCDSAAGSPDISPRVSAALDTLDRHWPGFIETMPEMAGQVGDWLARLVATARRLVGQTSPPMPLAVPCPTCEQPTIFRLDTERGSIAVCSNPADRDDYGEQRQWTEIEWEDAHPRRVVSPK